MNTSATDEYAIAHSKKKLLLLLAGACLFVASGYWFFQMDDAQIATLRRFNAPWFVRGMGICCMVFFGFCGLFVGKKLFDKKPGLVLNAQGIYIYDLAIGLIPWPDIAGFGVYEMHGQKTLVFKLHEPKKYIDSGNALQRKLHQLSTQMCGSPVAISANTLQIGFDDLQAICNRYWKKYGRRSGR